MDYRPEAIAPGDACASHGAVCRRGRQRSLVLCYWRDNGCAYQCLDRHFGETGLRN